jgi:hypothetical protein
MAARSAAVGGFGGGGGAFPTSADDTETDRNHYRKDRDVVRFPF